MHVRHVRNAFLFPPPPRVTLQFFPTDQSICAEILDTTKGNVCAMKHTRQDYKRKFLLELLRGGEMNQFHPIKVS